MASISTGQTGDLQPAQARAALKFVVHASCHGALLIAADNLEYSTHRRHQARQWLAY